MFLPLSVEFSVFTSSSDRGLAAEKRKAEKKANPQPKTKSAAKKAKAAPPAALEEWPEDPEDLDGEDLSDPEDMSEVED